MVKTIIFDIGGVVVSSLDKKVMKDACIKFRLNPLKLRALIKKYEPGLQMGKIDFAEFLKKVLGENKRAYEELSEDFWISSYMEKTSVNESALNLVKKLNKNYLVGCISNTIEPHVYCNRKRGLLKFFEPCLLSNEIGMRKPDERIFQLYLEKACCKPSEAVFIDDEKKYLATPEKLGIRTIHFKNTDKLENDLASLGIK